MTGIEQYGNLAGMFPIQPSDTEGVKWQKLQSSIKAAVIANGVTIPTNDPLLSDVQTGDTEGVKWAKTQRWMALLSTGGSGGSGAEGPTGPTGPAGATGPAGSGVSVVTQLTASRGLVDGDAGLYLYNTGAAKVVTLTGTPLSVGQEVQFFQAGSGTITIAVGENTVVANSLVTDGVGSFMNLKKVGTSTYHLSNI